MGTTAFGKPKDDDVINILDLDQVDDTPFYCPPGTYTASCSDCKQSTSKEGNPMLVFKLTVETPGEAKGKDVTIFAAMTPAAMWKVKETLAALGYDVATKNLAFKPQSAIGRKCQIVVEDSEYNGQKRSNVKSAKPLPAAKAAAPAVPGK